MLWQQAGDLYGVLDLLLEIMRDVRAVCNVTDACQRRRRRVCLCE